MTATQFEQLVLPLFQKYRADWLATARATARQLGRDGKVLTVDDVRAVTPPPPEVDPRVMAAVFTRKEWERLEYTQGSRAESHGRPVAKFRLRQA